MLRYTLDPAMPVLLRPDCAVQIGWDPRRAVRMRPPAGLGPGGLATVIRALAAPLSRAEARRLARAHGLSDDAGFDAVLSGLVSAGVLREGDRRIKSLAAWRWVEGRDGQSAVTDSVRESYDPIPGRARMSVLVQIGDELNGHEGIVHGGFSAALLDDLIGWTTMAEIEVQQLPGAPLTASLNLKYLRPVFSDRTYVVNMRAEQVQRRQRPGPPSWAVTLNGEICDEEGNACVRAEALYVVKTFTAASLEKAAKGG